MMNAILSRENLTNALKRVEANKGSAGVDGMSTKALRTYLVTHWPSLKEEIKQGTYRPDPVRRVEIPKPSGGKRKLGIPTVKDRLIQQAIAQVLSEHVDPTFSEHSYGFRPKKRGHDAVRKAKGFIEEGRRWVVDIDLSAFFDRVHHDRLMRRLSQIISDPALLSLIRKYLQAGVMEKGLVQPNTEGTPQGGPLSPLLSNIVLDEWDKELEKRGYAFVRYADDCQIYVKSRRAAEQTKGKMTAFLEKRMKLKVNHEKSAVDRPWKRSFLGFSFTNPATLKIRVSQKSIQRAKAHIRSLTSRRQSMAMEDRIQRLNRYLIGWCGYFQLAETPTLFNRLDQWIRRRLRMIRWKEWKKGKARFRNLMAHGVPRPKAWEWAQTRKGYWRIAHSPVLHRALGLQYWKNQGLESLLERYEHLRST
jgi:RNA-directed DNA polymerase